MGGQRKREGERSSPFVGSCLSQLEKNRRFVCSGGWKKHKPGSGTIDSLFKRPLPLHTLLWKGTQTRCHSRPQGSGAPSIHTTKRYQANTSLMKTFTCRSFQEWELGVASFISCCSANRTRRNTGILTAWPFWISCRSYGGTSYCKLLRNCTLIIFCVLFCGVERQLWQFEQMMKIKWRDKAKR